MGQLSAVLVSYKNIYGYVPALRLPLKWLYLHKGLKNVVAVLRASALHA